MVIQFPGKLLTFRQRQEDAILEALELVVEALEGRGYDTEPWIDDIYYLLEAVTERGH